MGLIEDMGKQEDPRYPPWFATNKCMVCKKPCMDHSIVDRAACADALNALDKKIQEKNAMPGRNLQSNVPERFSLLGILGGLMVSENLGDVADEIDHLHDLLGLPRPAGSFVEGWTQQDRVTAGLRPKPFDPRSGANSSAILKFIGQPPASKKFIGSASWLFHTEVMGHKTVSDCAEVSCSGPTPIDEE